MWRNHAHISSKKKMHITRLLSDNLGLTMSCFWRVSDVFDPWLCKFLCYSEPSLTEVRLQAPADCNELLAPCVDVSDGRHGPPVQPGQVPCLVFGEAATVHRAARL